MDGVDQSNEIVIYYYTALEYSILIGQPGIFCNILYVITHCKSVR